MSHLLRIHRVAMDREEWLKMEGMDAAATVEQSSVYPGGDHITPMSVIFIVLLSPDGWKRGNLSEWLVV